MFVGIDIGTGSLKAVMGFRNTTHKITGQYVPAMFSDGEHISEYFEQSVRLFLKEISAFSKGAGEKIEGISLCGHGPSLVVVDKNGRPVTGIITWQNNKAVTEALKLKSLIPGFSKDGTSYEAKLLKLFTDRTDLFEGGYTVLYPKDFVILLLTNRKIIDFSTASTIEFFNNTSEFFETFSTDIPCDIFPEVVKSWEIAGITNTDFSGEAGLENNIPVVAGGIDAWCEALGAGAVNVGMLVDGSGTSTCVTCCRKGNESDLVHVIPGRSLNIETMSATGTSISWIMDILNIDISEISEIRSFSPIPVIYLPYMDGERSPVWDEKASASFTGLSSKDSRADIIRSILQGIAFGTRQCIDLAGGVTADYDIGIRAVGGGSKNRALLQFKADISGHRYSSMGEADAAPLGAMILASYSCGGETLNLLVNKWVKTEFDIIPDNTYRDIWDELFSIYSNQFSLIKETSHSLFEIRNRLIK